MTSSANDPGSSDFETLARQYFGAWGDALRHAAVPGTPAGDDPGSWKRLFDWWGQLLPGTGAAAPEEAVRRFRAVAPFGAPTSSGMVTLHCPPQTLHGLAVFLREKGALSVSVGPLDYVFTAENPLYEKLEARLG